MSRWFRLYDDLLDDPKVQRLPAHLFKAWVNLLCLTSKSDGVLPPVADIAFRMRASEHDVQGYIDELILAGLIDIRSDRKLEPHKWPERQFQSDMSKERTRKWRDKKKKTDSDDAVTSPVTGSDEKCDGIDSDSNADSNTEPEQTRERAKSGFEIGNVTGSEVPEVEPELLRRAEGLGLNARAIEGECYGPKVKNPSAYFQSLCRKRLREQLPGLSDDVIGRGFCGDLKAYGVLMDLLVRAQNATSR